MQTINGTSTKAYIHSNNLPIHSCGQETGSAGTNYVFTSIPMMCVIEKTYIGLHVDLWSPGHMADHDGYKALVNTMCDITQFVVIVPVPDETSATLTSHFMQHVLLKFGMCHLVVIDDGTPFKGAFVAMCQVLNLNYGVLAKRNHK